MLLGNPRKEDEMSDISNVTGMTGRPEIDAISTMSFDLKAKRQTNILDSEVKGMDKFAKVCIP